MDETQTGMVGVLVWIVIGGGVGYAIGKARGREEYGAALGALLGIIGWVIVLCSEDNRPTCPACKGTVIAGATKCKNCGSDLMPTPTIPRREHEPSPGASPFDEPIEPRTRVNCPACGYGMMATVDELHHGLKCSRCKMGFVPLARKHA